MNLRRRGPEGGDEPTLERDLWLLMEAAADNLDLEDLELVDALVARGVERLRARRLVLFAPIAFGRVILARLDVTVDPTYVVVGGGAPPTKPRPLASVAEYDIAESAATQMGGNDPGFRALVLRSAEVDAVNQALNEGASVEGAVFEPAMILWHV